MLIKGNRKFFVYLCEIGLTLSPTRTTDNQTIPLASEGSLNKLIKKSFINRAKLIQSGLGV